MAPDFKNKKNIFNLSIWVIAVVDAAVLAGLVCNSLIYEEQFIDATVFGYLVITSIVFASICLEEEIPEKTFYCIIGPGAIMYIITGILIFLNYHGGGGFTTIGIRIILGGVFALGNGALLLCEFILLLVKKDFFD